MTKSNAKALALACLIIPVSLFCQSDSITAGQLPGMEFTGYATPFALVVDSPNPGGGGVSLAIDFNHDGFIDLTIQIAYAGDSLGSSVTTTFKTSAYCQLYCVLDSARNSIGYDGCDSLFHWVAKKFLAGDSIRTVTDSSWQRGTITVEHFLTAAGAGSCELTNYVQPTDYPYYYFFQLLSAAGTKLGYINFSAAASLSQTDTLYNYAIQGPQSTDIIGSINAPGLEKDIKIYPVPFSDQIHITCPVPFTFYLNDITGKLALSGSSNTINASTLESGIYLLTLQTSDGRYVKKLIKSE